MLLLQKLILHEIDSVCSNVGLAVVHRQDGFKSPRSTTQMLNTSGLVFKCARSLYHDVCCNLCKVTYWYDAVSTLPWLKPRVKAAQLLQFLLLNFSFIWNGLMTFIVHLHSCSCAGTVTWRKVYAWIMHRHACCGWKVAIEQDAMIAVRQLSLLKICSHNPTRCFSCVITKHTDVWWTFSLSQPHMYGLRGWISTSQLVAWSFNKFTQNKPQIQS